MSAPIVAGRPGTIITPFVSNKLLHNRTEMSCWQGVNHGMRTSTSKPSWFSSCSCSSSAMTVSSVCCYRNTSRKGTSTATDVAAGLTPKNGQIPPTDPDSGDDVCHIPQPVFSLFVYLAQQGGHVNDMFRRPGNITQMKQILHEFTSGNPVNWSEYNVYTVANVAKKLLLSIPDGLFGVRGEALLLSTASGSSCSTEVDELLDPVLSSRSVVAESHCSRLFPPGDQKTVTFADDLNPLGSVSSRLPRGSVIQLTQLSEVAERRIAVFLRVLESLPSSHRQFSILVFGLLHQLVMNATSSVARCSLSSLVDLSRSSGTLLPKREDTKDDDGLAVAEVPLLVLAEGVVKSVAGALFHTCCSSIHLVEQAAQVLRTLVLFFPAMGDSVTRFFVEAVANRLPPRKTLAADSGGSGRPVTSRSFCVLCPETGHTGHFGHHSDDKGGLRQCPLNLIHVASRLFCLSGWRTTPQQKSTLSPSTCLPPAKSSNLLPRLRCAPFSSKAQSSTICSSTERVSLITTVSSDITSPANASAHSTNNTEPSGRAEEEKPLETDGTLNTEKGLPSQGPDIIVERCAPTLRRNQSRYRSLRRRQMENLSRRAEWFLGPTVLPVVTLTPASGIPPDPLHRVGQLPPKEHDDFTNSREMVVTSTVSLLDLDDSIRRELKDSTQLGGCHAMSIQPPRLLFVASTGELEQQQDFDIQSRDSCLVQRKDSGRQRLLSVGCYLNPTPADSFVSVYSAPSAGLHRFDATGPAVSVPSVNHSLEYRSAVSAAQFPSIGSPSSQALDLQSQPATLFLHPRPPEALRVRQPRPLAEPPNYSTDTHILPAVVQSGSCFSLSTPQKLSPASHADPIPIGMPEHGGRPRSNSAWAALPLPTCARSYASPYPSYEEDRSHHR